MTIENLMLQSEALIFASDRPLTPDDITQLIKDSNPDETLDFEKLPSALEAIVEKYASDFYPFEVKQIGGGFQFLSKATFYPILSKLNGDKFNKRLSTAALETLAIIAYKQPITKTDIEHIRGVNSDYSVQKLLEKELIYISGRLEDSVGKPLTFSTTRTFMDYLGLNSLDQLPSLSEMIVPENMVTPTQASEAIPENDQVTLAVAEDGSLIEIPENNISPDELTEDNDTTS